MNRTDLIRELRAVVGAQFALVEKEDVIVYEQDGSIFQVMPEIVVLPSDVEQVSNVVKLAKQADVPPIRLHDARHTSVTIMRGLGVADHVVAAWHGHDEAVMARVRALR